MAAMRIWIAGYGGPPAAAIGAIPVWIATGDGSIADATEALIDAYGGPFGEATAVWIAGYGGPPPAAIGAIPIFIGGYAGAGGSVTPPVESSVWSAADAAANGMTLSNGGLTVTPSANAGFQSVRSSISQTAGKFYIEFKALGPNAKATQMAWGIANAAFNPVGYLGGSGSSIGAFNVNAGNFVTAGFTSIIALGAPTIVANDVWAIAIDLTAGKYWMAQNNVWVGGGSPSAGTSPMITIGGVAAGQAYFPALSLEAANSAWVLQSTAASQKYAPPSGFSAWDGGAAPSHSAEALAYLARTVGGNEGGNGANIATLIDGLVSDGVWAKLDALYVLAQQNETDAQLNLIGTSYSLTINAILERDISFTQYVGFSGFDNGLFINTHFNPTTATSPLYVQNSASLGVWSYANANTAGVDIGVDAAAANILVSYSNTFYARLNGSAGGIPTPGTKGFYAGDRSSSANVVQYWNGASQGAQSSASAAVLNNFFIIGNATGGAFPTTNTLSAAFIGASLGAAGQLALYNRLRTYMTAVGVP